MAAVAVEALVSWLAVQPVGDAVALLSIEGRLRSSVPARARCCPETSRTTARTAGQHARGVSNRPRTWRTVIAQRVATGITIPGNGPTRIPARMPC
jgi:hypothetical protein